MDYAGLLHQQVTSRTVFVSMTARGGRIRPPSVLVTDDHIVPQCGAQKLSTSHTYTILMPKLNDGLRLNVRSRAGKGPKSDVFASRDANIEKATVTGPNMAKCS